MTTELTVFNFDPNTNIRTVMIDGEPHFVAKDICDALDIINSNKAIADLRSNYESIGIDAKGITISYPLQTAGGMQEMTIITEAGLYDLTAQSRKPNALKFKYWVHTEVLPSIRKNGFYGTDSFVDMALNDTDNLIVILQKYKFEKQSRQLAEQQRDEAIRTKAYIGSKREATAMAHTAIFKKENEKLKTQIGNSERYKQVTAILWLKEFFNMHIEAIYKVVGKRLSTLSTNLEIATIYVESIKYNKVKAYDIDVINYFKQQLMEDKDKTIMTKYRLN